MKKIKKMGAGHIYLIRGSSTANSALFEGIDDCQQFLELADHYLKEYLTVSSFQNSRDGWVMIVATKSEALIKQAYSARRSLSKKCKEEFELKEVWRMLSDQVRIFLSTYVKKINRRTGRKGAMVRHRYERFVFESEEEALQMKVKLEEERYNLEQPVERYRPSEEMSELQAVMVKTSIYMSCALLKTPEMLSKLGMACLDLGVLVSNVARQMIQNTFHHHFPT